MPAPAGPLPEPTVIRPDAGTITRPNMGTIARPDAGVIERPVSGTAPTNGEGYVT